MNDAQIIAHELKMIADDLEQSNAVIQDHQLFVYTRKINNAKYTIRCCYDVDSIRTRADKLLKQYSKRVKTTSQTPRLIRSTKQAKYSNRVANQFIKDNEFDNYKAYRGIYGLPDERG